MSDPDRDGPAPEDAAAAKLAVGDLPQHMDALPQSALLDASGDAGDDTDRSDHHDSEGDRG